MDDECDRLRDAVDDMCDVDSGVCDDLKRGVEYVCGDGVEPITMQEFTSGKHSYRGYEPIDILRLIEAYGTERGEKGSEKTARDGMRFIESGRMDTFLEDVSGFFSRLDDDERELFTERNPDVVEWMTVWNEAAGLNPMLRWREEAQENLRGGEDGRGEASDPPEYDRGARSVLRDRDALWSDMATRRRSYRGWTPQEFEEIMDIEEMYELSAGQTRSLGALSAEDIRDMEEKDLFPWEVEPRYLARQLLERVESGRFYDMLDSAMRFYNPLDRDERRMFSRRNPGLLMWISVYGKSNHLINGEQLRAHTYPTLEEE